MSPTLFFAALLPPEFCSRLEPRLRALREIDQRIRTVRAEGLHVTLQFLGRVDPDLVPELLEVGGSVAGRHAAFSLEMGGLGHFGPGDRPTVIWLGVGQGSRELAELNRALAVKLTEARLPCDRRRFRPHCTLARVSGELAPGGRTGVKGLTGLLEHVALEPLEVKEIHLMESVPVAGEPNRHISRGAMALG